MKRYKLDNKPVTPPPDEVIRKHKDFARLKANYQVTLERIHKRPLYRDPRMLFGLALVLLIMWLILMLQGADPSATGDSNTAPVDGNSMKTEQVE